MIDPAMLFCVSGVALMVALLFLAGKRMDEEPICRDE